MPVHREEPFTDPNNPELDNPHRVGNESAAENHAANHESTFDMLHDEMKGRVHLEQNSIWAHLKLDDVDGDLVRQCSQQLRTSCNTSIVGLQQITKRNRKGGSGTEPNMYPHLVRFFY